LKPPAYRAALASRAAAARPKSGSTNAIERAHPAHAAPTPADHQTSSRAYRYEKSGLGASGDVSVKVKSDGERRLNFEATKPLVFAFQAVQLCFLKGAYRTLRVERSTMQIMSDKGLRTGAAETGWLCDEIGFTFTRFGAARR
jgi:hypothetical protein